jgi:hypothetical protein
MYLYSLQIKGDSQKKIPQALPDRRKRLSMDEVKRGIEGKK